MSRVLQHVAEEELLHAHDTQEAARRRRAAVFYLDRGGGLEMVRWCCGYCYARIYASRLALGGRTRRRGCRQRACLVTGCGDKAA